MERVSQSERAGIYVTSHTERRVEGETLRGWNSGRKRIADQIDEEAGLMLMLFRLKERSE